MSTLHATDTYAATVPSTVGVAVTAVTTTATKGTTKPVTVAAAHHALVAIATLTVFVLVLTVLAGTNTTLGHGIVALLVAMLLMQGITHVDPVTEWISNHPL